MLVKKNYEYSPSYGFIKREFKRFNDNKLFKELTAFYISLKSIKLWYGTPAKGDDYLDTKAILGIECGYKLMDGKLIKAEKHCAKIESNDVDTKELSLENDDFFSKFHICFDDVVTYIKLESYKGKVIELGNYDEKFKKTISFNDSVNPHVIQYFYGFYDDFALRAVGFQHIPKIRMYIFASISILRLRHIIKTDENQKEYWSKDDNLSKLDIGMKALIKTVFLPDAPFSTVFKYLVG